MRLREQAGDLPTLRMQPNASGGATVLDGLAVHGHTDVARERQCMLALKLGTRNLANDARDRLGWRLPACAHEVLRRRGRRRKPAFQVGWRGRRQGCRGG